ncbi:aminopeptidase N [Oryzobacter telluris]|uniref:aminopeptidase N n=1 Tax=Oryzobacter telluris TaxID=3149179 RepID=UPI00370DD374
MPSLTRAEAATRAALLTVTAMEVDLDLDQGVETFGSRTTISFTAREEGASTFVDLRPRALHRVALNGTELDPAALDDGRLVLHDLAAENVLEVEATMAYSHDGQGLHRSTDPADDEDYVYGHLFLDAAPTVFACFDQPDLKAPYSVAVTAPQEWTVIGNGGATLESPGRTVLATTPPLATYFVTVCAGPWASVHDEHDGIPMGLHARRSLEPYLREQAEHMFAATRVCFDEYHRLFGIRYPFGEYHQAFVPEFNAGAMENPGCVTFRDTMIHRGAATPDQLLQRTNTIAHEMAHMWFGDLVTMRWWDDLWLNESFAEYMAYRVCTAVTEFTDAWVEFGVIRKHWGYAAERSPSTHPVAGSPAPDALSALGNFDGISYAKGASVIRQLIAHIGDDAFVRGVAAYLADHAYGNGELSEFLAAMEAAHGSSLEAWSAAWLQTSGADRLALDGDVLTRTAPADHPADRPHTLDVAAFADGAEVARVEVVATSDRTPVPGLADLPDGALVVPNAGDLTWAEVTLDEATVAGLPAGLASVPDASARAVVWVSLLGAVNRGEVDPRAVIDVFAAAWPHESDAAVLARVSLVTTSQVVPVFLPPDEQPAALARVAAAADELLDRAGHEPGVEGDALAVLAARVWGRTATDADRLRSWVAGDDLPVVLAGDDDFRWVLLRRLAGLDALSESEIRAAEEADRSLAGSLAALGVRAARPTAEAKQWAWARLRDDATLSNYAALSIASAFWSAPDLDLVRPYVGEVGDLLVGMSARMSDDAMSRVVGALHPTTVVEDATAEATAALLAREDLTPGVRRALVDADHVLHEALTSRRRFG